MTKFDEDERIYGETYTYRASCPNCRSSQNVSIPKGTTIKSFMSSQTCDTCGCAMVEPDYKYRMNCPEPPLYEVIHKGA